ncbi:hypothetical protein ACFOM8_01950 [Paracoccus angustae]|uniref:Tat pathway signal protein n=1 Tax=Paracoccus angustae TaxID=1671480 RepID=A0ABV7TZS2_9RHOB
MKRRNLLKAIPAVAVLPVMGVVPAEAETETPVEDLFRRWLVLDAEESRIYAESDDEDEHAAATDRKIEVENQMRAAPKLKFTDVALTILASTSYGLFGLSDEWRDGFRDEARALIAA